MTERLGGLACIQHGPSCQDPDHAYITLGAWRSSNGLCASCGEPGNIVWGNLNRPSERSRRCRRCALTEQIEHARERAAALPNLEAELAALSSPLPEEG